MSRALGPGGAGQRVRPLGDAAPVRARRRARAVRDEGRLPPAVDRAPARRDPGQRRRLHDAHPRRERDGEGFSSSLFVVAYILPSAHPRDVLRRAGRPHAEGRAARRHQCGARGALRVAGALDRQRARHLRHRGGPRRRLAVLRAGRGRGAAVGRRPGRVRRGELAEQPGLADRADRRPGDPACGVPEDGRRAAARDPVRRDVRRIGRGIPHASTGSAARSRRCTSRSRRRASVSPRRGTGSRSTPSPTSASSSWCSRTRPGSSSRRCCRGSRAKCWA